MDMAVYYAYLGISFLLMLFVVFLKFAGLEAMYALYRMFKVRGADVFLVDQNRHVNHFYMTPKDGVFLINKKMYVTNPEKVLSLSDDMIKEYMQNNDRKLKKYQSQIDKLTDKKKLITLQIESISKTGNADLNLLDRFKMELTNIDTMLNTLEAKLKQREQGYFYRKRPAYFFVENDPVAKDFHEFLTDLDSTILENMIIRAETKSDKNIQPLIDKLPMLEKAVWLLILGMGIIGFFMYRVYQIMSAGGVKFF